MLFYKGTKTSGYIQPRDLSNYDIVVTTYSILQSETNYVDLPHSNSEEGEFLKPKNLQSIRLLKGSFTNYVYKVENVNGGG